MPPKPTSGDVIRIGDKVMLMKAREVLSGKKVFISGGAGFVGSFVADLLVQSDVREVVILDNMTRGRVENLTQSMASGRLRLITGDIRNTQLLSELIDGCDYVFHLAALRITQCAAEPRTAVEVMIDATYQLAECCRVSGVRKIVMASSASVYGMAQSFPTDENHHAYGNRTLYGAAKAFGEGLLRSFNDMYGTDYVCLRFFNVYGPRMDIHGKYTEVLIRWMERIEAGEPPIIFGDGKQTMDMLHVRDVAKACLLSATSPATDVALNVGSGTETSLYNLARHLANVMGRPDLEPAFWEERAVNPVPRRLADTALARRLIGFETTIPLDEGLAELVDWWRAERHANPRAFGARS